MKPQEPNMPPGMVPSVIVLIEDADGRLAAIEETKHGGRPAVPGGKVEETDADLEAAIRRETREEIGVELVDLERVFGLPIAPRPTRPTGSPTFWATVYTARLAPGAELKDSPEGRAVRVTRQDLLTRSAYVDVYPAIFEAFDLWKVVRAYRKAALNLGAHADILYGAAELYGHTQGMALCGVGEVSIDVTGRLCATADYLEAGEPVTVELVFLPTTMGYAAVRSDAR